MYDNFTLGGFNMAQRMAAQQGGHLAGMINQAQNLWGDELDSRVAQNREMRRMEQERYMEELRQATILKKLQMEQQLAMQEMRAKERQQRIAQDRAAGIINSTAWNSY